MISCAFFSLDFFVLDSASILASASSFIIFICASSLCFALSKEDHHQGVFIVVSVLSSTIDLFFSNHKVVSYAFGQNCDWSVAFILACLTIQDIHVTFPIMLNRVQTEDLIVSIFA